MGKWLLGICIAIMGATLVATEADAKRLGGGRSVGTQRNVTPAPAKSAPQQAAPQQQQAQPAQQGSRWGMLGGILAWATKPWRRRRSLLAARCRQWTRRAFPRASTPPASCARRR